MSSLDETTPDVPYTNQQRVALRLNIKYNSAGSQPNKLGHIKQGSKQPLAKVRANIHNKKTTNKLILDSQVPSQN